MSIIVYIPEFALKSVAPYFFFIRTFSCVQIVIVISNTTNKQQGAHQHLIYLRAQQQLCIFFFLLHFKFIFMIFFSLSRKMLHIYSFLWLARKPSHLKCLVMCDLETLLKWQISFLSDFITGDAKNFGRGLDVTDSKTTCEVVWGLCVFLHPRME